MVNKVKFTVDYSLKKDTLNYLARVWRKDNAQIYGRDPSVFLKDFPSEFQNNLTKAQNEHQAFDIILDYLKSKETLLHTQTTQYILKWVDRILNEESADIVSQLESVYQQPVPFDQITVYLTTYPICPYNYKERWFMCKRNGSIDHFSRIARHELNHFMYYYYWRDFVVSQNISENKSEILKEAMAILTNPEGNDKPTVKPLEAEIVNHIGQPIDKIVTSAINCHYFKNLNL